MGILERHSLYLGSFAIFLLALLSLQLYEESLKLTATSTGLVVLLFGVLLVLSFPDIIKFKVGPGGFEFERQAYGLTQKLLAPSVTRTATITSSARIEAHEPDSRSALFATLVDIEREMARLAGSHGITPSLGFGGLIGVLTSREVLDHDLHEALEFLRTIRNSAFHGEYLTESQTEAALNLATVVLEKLKAKESGS